MSSKSGSAQKPYIVYMGELSSGLEQLAVESHHHNLLAETIGDESVAKAAKIHSYGRSINGFAARLLPSEAQRLSEKSNVVSVFPSTIRKLLTTRSWDFLGMPENLKQRNLQRESDVIVGLLDTDWTVSVAHGAGAIIAADDPIESAYTTLIPASFVSAEAGKHIGRYINTTKSPQAVIYKTRVVHTTKAPMVASFSSRGPQTQAKNILKPDISAPGMDILAAFSKLAPITDYDEDKRRNVYNIITGTSMACPHVSGAAAYVKTFHPDWSPAAIKPALMTTAKPVNGNSSEDPLNSGAGLLNPVDAVHPGLVYDISPKDYIRYLCFEGYNESALSLIHGTENSTNHYNCSKFKQGIGADGLNYPSMHLQLAVNATRISGVFHRTVTYVGHGAAVYKAQVTSPNKGVSIKVIPDVLIFTKARQKRSFNVMVKGTVTDPTSTSTLDDWWEPTIYTHNSFLEWVESSSNHRVRSPIVIYRPYN